MKLAIGIFCGFLSLYLSHFPGRDIAIIADLLGQSSFLMMGIAYENLFYA